MSKLDWETKSRLRVKSRRSSLIRKELNKRGEGKRRERLVGQKKDYSRRIRVPGGAKPIIFVKIGNETEELI